MIWALEIAIKVTVETEFGMMQKGAKKCWQFVAAGWGMGQGMSTPTYWSYPRWNVMYGFLQMGIPAHLWDFAWLTLHLACLGRFVHPCPFRNTLWKYWVPLLDSSGSWFVSKTLNRITKLPVNIYCMKKEPTLNCIGDNPVSSWGSKPVTSLAKS